MRAKNKNIRCYDEESLMRDFTFSSCCQESEAINDEKETALKIS